MKINSMGISPSNRYHVQYTLRKSDVVVSIFRGEVVIFLMCINEAQRNIREGKCVFGVEAELISS